MSESKDKTEEILEAIRRLDERQIVANSKLENLYNLLAELRPAEQTCPVPPKQDVKGIMTHIPDARQTVAAKSARAPYIPKPGQVLCKICGVKYHDPKYDQCFICGRKTTGGSSKW